MNLASILNLTPAAPGTPTLPEAANTPATSLVGEFSALLGLAVLPATVEEPAQDAASTGKDLPGQHGNLLPEAAANDMLPGEPASLMALPSFLIITLPKQPEVRGAAVSAEVPGQVLQTILPEALAAKQAAASPQPAPPATGGAMPAPAAPATSAAPAAATAPAPAAPVSAAPVSAAHAPAQGLHIQFDLLPPAAPAIQQARTPQAEAAAPTAQQLAAMPAVQALDPRRELAERSANPPVTAAAVIPKEGELQATAPVAPAAAPVLPSPVATPVAAPEAARVGPIDTPAAPASAPRHDFEAVVERLSEARELARPGRATMQLAHREFGAVSVQFDMAGQSLKVGLASSDTAFAPAVQAALAVQAERPVMASGEAQGSRSDQQRSDQQLPAAQSSAAPASQGDGQARDQQARNTQGRHPSDQVQRQPQDGGERSDNAAASGRARDGSLFA
ncbi:hypothetical protein M3P36_14130 [Altererythrobacter sp. KTW20L]|uniref:hypothetical protein n=1 Tax=Altererythrobacter sp. KTW20L TaxID=2942210 RepID=UPI0020C04517|nr:hypothetical protein [Altererythrobacter sp. KTW20L]MCL6252179.1 hypothetical protein [Altererythrobacter sp. KTW20L]